MPKFWIAATLLRVPRWQWASSIIPTNGLEYPGCRSEPDPSWSLTKVPPPNVIRPPGLNQTEPPPLKLTSELISDELILRPTITDPLDVTYMSHTSPLDLSQLMTTIPQSQNVLYVGVRMSTSSHFPLQPSLMALSTNARSNPTSEVEPAGGRYEKKTPKPLFSSSLT